MVAVVLVTGCSSGLGRAICLGLSRKRSKSGDMCFRVIASSRRLQAIQDLSEEGVDILEMDVTDQRSTAVAVQRAVAIAGQVDVLVCNAGIAATAPLVEQDIAEVQNIFDTNCLGALRCIQAIVPIMKAQKQGKIMVVGSITACLASPFNGAYAASKAAVHSMCETLSMELDPFGICVTEVWAGTMRTDINAKVASNLERYAKPESAYYQIAAEIKERSEYLEHSKSMLVDQVAKDIIRGLEKKSAPRYIYTGADVMSFTIMGYMQSWICPGTVNAGMQKMFGLTKLKQFLAKDRS